MKALVGAFNQEKALVGAFSVITNLRMDLFQALMYSRYPARYPLICPVALLLGKQKNPSKSVFECIIMLVGAILVKMSRNGFIKIYEDKENIVWVWNV